MPDTPEENQGDALAQARAEVARLQADNARLTELLDMAQDFGRLGVWERDPVTLEGRWDRHVFRFFGFEPGTTPPFEEAVKRVHPDDSLRDTFHASLKKPGSYSERFRVVRPDGSFAHIHSQWRTVPDAQGRTARVVGVMMDDTETLVATRRMATEHAQLGLALSLSGIGLWRHEIADARLYHDARALSILGRESAPQGLPLEEVRGWIHPDDLAEVLAAHAQTLEQGGPVDARTRYRHVDGSWRTLLTRRVLQRDEAGQPLRILGVALDVTEQQERMAQALQLARRLEAAADAAHVGLWSTPLDGGPPEWNPNMYRLLGCDPAAGPLSMGAMLRELAPEEDRDRVATAVLDWIRGDIDAQLDLEVRVLHPGGAVRRMEIRGRQEVDPDGVHRAFGVLLDFTEQYEALLALREANERNSLALSAVGMGTWSHDAQNGRADWDDQMFHLRGLEPSSQAPDTEDRMALVVPEDRAAVSSQSMPYLVSPQPLAYEFQIKRADTGAVRTIASRSIALTDEDGRVVRRIGVNWDVTEARSVERAQRERELALRESRTQAALFTRISHELRTPLNAVLGFTQLLLAGDAAASPMQRRERLLQIQSAGESLLAAVNGVLDLSEQTDAANEPARESVPIGSALDRALAPLAVAIAARSLTIERADLMPAVIGDARRVQQVLAQLLSNAVKFNRHGGRVHIGARVQAREVVIGIGDQGPGIDAARLPYLFEPPWGDGARAGADRGIGLVIAQATAQRMGGRIDIARSDAKGSTFELRLPWAGAQAPSAAGSTAGGNGPRVLYIEDNDVNMLIVRELLAKRPRLAFHGASDGESGVRAAIELQPALVLIDMQLPDIDGMQVLRLLRADPRTASATCVALSANAMTEDVQRARAAGFDDYWTKPIDLAAFLTALDRLLPTS